MKLRQLKRLKPRRACQLNHWRQVGFYANRDWYGSGNPLDLGHFEDFRFIEDEFRRDGTMRRTLF